MKTKYFTVMARIWMAALLVLAGSAQAADLVRYMGQPNSKIVMEGTSTIHDWDMESNLIGGYLELDPAIVIDPSKAEVAGAKEGEKVNANAVAMIPVRSFKSDNNKMDEIMQEAMNEPKNPRITYKLKEMKLKENRKAGTPVVFATKGDLTVNGVSKEVAMEVSIEPEGNDANRLKVTSEKITLKMTDFDVKPPQPKIALGMIKTGDEIEISFTWFVAKRG